MEAEVKRVMAEVRKWRREFEEATGMGVRYSGTWVRRKEATGEKEKGEKEEEKRERDAKWLKWEGEEKEEEEEEEGEVTGFSVDVTAMQSGMGEGWFEMKRVVGSVLPRSA